jgi:hypothetical protein
MIVSLSGELSPERLASLTRDLNRNLSRAGVPASLVAQPPSAGERGDAVTIGQIALGLISGGALTAVIECLKAYFVRERTLVVKLTRPDGQQIEVNAKNIDDALVLKALSGAVT